MEIKIVPVGNRVEIEFTIQSGSTFYGVMNATEQMLVGEAKRIRAKLDEIIKEAEKRQRPGVRKLGSY